MNRAYLTGDTHGIFSRFEPRFFPDQVELTKEDVVIVLGDFGGIWEQTATNEEKWLLDWLNNRKFTVAFIDGNHENHDRLDSEFPEVEFCGGKAHQIRPSIFHLMRGEIYNIGGMNFFSFGGAASHDIQDGILNIEDYGDYQKMVEDYLKKKANGKLVRVNHYSWWEREMPSKEEMKRGISNIKKVNGKIDYVLSHSLPTEIQSLFGGFSFSATLLTDYFQNEIVPLLKDQQKVRWYSGHYHLEDKTIYNDNFIYTVKYHGIERIV